jgi:hypothetical protein
MRHPTAASAAELRQQWRQQQSWRRNITQVYRSKQRVARRRE